MFVLYCYGTIYTYIRFFSQPLPDGSCFSQLCLSSWTHDLSLVLAKIAYSSGYWPCGASPPTSRAASYRPKARYAWRMYVVSEEGPSPSTILSRFWMHRSREHPDTSLMRRHLLWRQDVSVAALHSKMDSGSWYRRGVWKVRKLAHAGQT